MARRLITVTLNPALDQSLFFSSFALGQVNRVERQQVQIGGKGLNVARTLRQLLPTAEIWTSGILGEENQKAFVSFLDGAALHDAFARLPGVTRTNFKLIDEGSAVVSEINFPGLSCPQETLAALLRRLLALVSPQSLVVLSGSLAPGLALTTYRDWVAALKEQGCRVYLDTSGAPLAAAVAAAPHFLKPNREELAALVGRPLETEAAVREAMEALLAQGVEEVVVSLGGEGALVATKDRLLRVRPPKVDVASTVGAGDALVAGMAAGAWQGQPLESRLRLATAVAAATVGRKETGAWRQLMPQIMVETWEQGAWKEAVIDGNS